MKKFFFLSFLFCTFLGINAQDILICDSTAICHGGSHAWFIDDATSNSVNVISYNGIYDTIFGNPIILSPDSTTRYTLISTDGHQPSIWVIYTCIITVNTPPTFTVDSIHSPTCPYPYLGPGSPDSPNSGPWADGSFSVTLNDSAQNYEYIDVRSDSSFFFVRTFYDSFTTGGLRGGTYNIIARGTNGCEVTQQVTIQQPPAWEHPTVTPVNVTCEHLGSIECTYSGGTPPLNWNWTYLQDTTLTFPNSPYITNLNAGRYNVDITDFNGCVFMNADFIMWDVYEILPDTINLHYYIPEDSVTLIECPESMEVCQYNPFFNALSLGHGEYLWSTGNITQNETGPHETGWLSVEFTDQNGCVTRDSVYLDVYDANISITADSIMNDDSVYTVTVSPLGGTLYLDGINGTEIPIGNGIIIFDASLYGLGTHELTYSGIWGEFGCYFDTTFQFTIQHQDGISDFERNTKLWPNPTSNVLNIEFSGEFSGDILLFDMTGRLLKTTEKESEITSIDVSDLTSGVYFIRFVSQNGTFTKKFVKK